MNEDEKDGKKDINEENKKGEMRKKSDITDKIINGNEKEGLIKGEESKDNILLQKKRIKEKNEIQNELDKDSQDEEPKKDTNEIIDKEKKEEKEEKEEKEKEEKEKKLMLNY